ncbi:MAG: HAD family hydrolase [Phycisphaera sp. TMED9]|nr:MAG: HAD family hydrolase [Phycisphaera sp. TMED9]
MTPRNLVLFDIDATLLDTQDAGVVAYEMAGVKVFGVAFSFTNVPLHGRLDSENYADAVRRHGLGVDHAEHVEAFQAAYATSLEKVAEDRGGFKACRGIVPLLEVLMERGEIQIGLLTGNWEHTGRFKIRAAGLDDSIFQCNAFADHGQHRDDLVPVARDRFESMHGTPPARVIVIGDTPRDVQCARAGHAESVAVATGVFDTDALRETGADVVVEDLSPTDSLLQFLSR